MDGVQVYVCQTIPVFWVICLLVIICLHLGSMSSLFLFCFRHWSMLLASASVQKRYNAKKQCYTVPQTSVLNKQTTSTSAVCNQIIHCKSRWRNPAVLWSLTLIICLHTRMSWKSSSGSIISVSCSLKIFWWQRWVRCFLLSFRHSITCTRSTLYRNFNWINWISR